jgi:CRISPR locus-related DNA-binding protein
LNTGKGNKSFFITLGWTEGPALTALTKHGLAEDDRVILLISDSGDEGSLAAVSNIRAIINRISNKIEIEELQIPIARFEEAVSIILKKMRGEKTNNRSLIINLSGGMRILIVETLIASMILGAEDIHLEIQSEDKKVLIEIPHLWEHMPRLTRPQVEMLKNLTKRSISVSELAEDLKLPISTTYRLLLEMERGGLVKTEKLGRERIAHPTMRGRLIAHINMKI